MASCLGVNRLLGRHVSPPGRVAGTAEPSA
jgi:hypothetical protein